MTSKRIISGLLALTMAAGMMPVDTVFAEDTNTTATTTITKENSSGDLTIRLKIKNSSQPTVTIQDWQYKGTASTPEVTNYDGDGKVTYYYKVKDADDNTYTTDVPTAVGSYTVKAVIAETEEYKEATATADFQITPMTSDMTITLNVRSRTTLDDFDVAIPEGLVYDGEPKEVKVTSKSNDAEFPDFEVVYFSGDMMLTSPPTEAGTYKFVIKNKDTEAYYANDLFDESFTFTIDRATPEVTAPQAVEDLRFNDQEHELVTPGKTSHGTMVYSLDGENFSEDIPMGKEADDYTVYYKVVCDDNNWNDTKPQTVKTSIVNEYEITWMNGEEEIFTDTFQFNEQVKFNGEVPTKEGAENEVYVFDGWTPEVTVAVDDATYTAKFIKYTRHDAVAETCEEAGNIEYYTDENGGFFVRENDGSFRPVTEEETIIDAKGHKYAARPVWTWSADRTTASATFICENDEAHNEVKTALIETNIVNPEIGKKGKKIIVATVTFQGKKYTNTIVSTIPAITVELVPAVEATCAKEGNKEYYKGSDGKYYELDGDSYKEIELADTVIEKLDTHSYSDPKFVWGENNTAKVVLTCSECGATESFDADVELVKKAPTYTEDGLYTYTASFELDGEVFTDTKEVVITSPEAIDVTSTPGDRSVKLTWNAVEGAERYAVCGKVDGEWKILKEGFATSCVLEGLQPDTDYEVTVIPMTQNIWCADFTHAITVQALSELPTSYPVVESQVSGRKIQLNWTPVDKAEQYGIAVLISGKWKVQTTVDSSVTSFTSPKLAAGTYKMVVCAKVGGNWDVRNVNSRAITVTIE